MAANTMRIRDATEKDIVPITELYNHYVLNTTISLEEQPSSPAAYLANFQNLQAGNWPFLVLVNAADEAAVCGFAYAGPFNARSGYRLSAEDSVYLHPDHCGQGHGRTLLDAVCVRLRQDGKRQVLAKMSILPEQAVEELPSYRLHKKLGFVVVGRMLKVGFKMGQWVDVLIMQLSLDGEKD